ncbi:MAG: N-acetylglutaminylglutamine synthetase, partial [Phycisphaeraceae bacterium]
MARRHGHNHGHDTAHRLSRTSEPSLRNWQKPKGPAARQMRSGATVDMGWGKLIFAHTFDRNDELIDTLVGEEKGRRDIALYLRDPHVVLSKAPQRLFLDPSHTYRLWTHQYRQVGRVPPGFTIRRIRTR